MRMLRITAALALVVALGGCLENNLQRTAVGAAGGAAIAGVAGGDMATGAIIGGAAGLTCKQLGVAACKNK